jgi:hypothetical protein
VQGITISAQHEFSVSSPSVSSRLDAAAPVLIDWGYLPSTIRAYQYYMAQCQAAFWEDQMQHTFGALN